MDEERTVPFPEGDLDFGETLKRLRLETNLSQVEFAHRLGLSPANLCDLEKGRVVPSPKRALAIARKLGIAERPVLERALKSLLRREQIHFDISLSYPPDSTLPIPAEAPCPQERYRSADFKPGFENGMEEATVRIETEGTVSMKSDSGDGQ